MASTASSFNDIWKNLVGKGVSDEERGQLYSRLTGLMKESAASPNSEAVLNSLCYHHRSLIKRILMDITCTSCDHMAIQALGYFLHNAEFARKFSTEQVAATINGLCDVINSASSKALCTRALWCLANQNFSNTQISDHVQTIVSIVCKVLSSQHLQSALTVDTEAFNLFTKLEEQCKAEFSSVTKVWYKIMVTRILFSKSSKLQRRALTLVSSHVEDVQSSTELVQWLCGYLKEHTVSVMLSQLSVRGVDHAHILNTWAHFVSTLGQYLHRHGSLLNEMLRVVEMGFKHRSVMAQTAAYHCWMHLISNFALDNNLLLSKKRLKLLLMPLLRAAVKDRSAQVEAARLKAWWHLIIALGPNRQAHFTQVCLPFLLLCIGVEPKLDSEQLSSLISTAVGDLSDQENTVTTGKGHTAVSRNRFISSIGCQFFVGVPTPSMMLTGCHAILQFAGNKMAVPDSLILSDLLEGELYPGGCVSLEMAQVLVLYLDGLGHYLNKKASEDCNSEVGNIVHFMMKLVIGRLSKAAVPSAGAKELALLGAVTHLLTSGYLGQLLSDSSCSQLLLALVSLPPHLLLAKGQWWKPLLNFSLFSPQLQSQVNSEPAWTKLVKVVGSKSSASDVMPNLLYLSDQLTVIMKEGSNHLTLARAFWMSLAETFSSSIAKTTQINHGTTLEPDFSSAVRILTFPFQHLLHHGDKNHVNTILEIWRPLYEVCLMHISLVVSDPNHCACLVINELYVAYGTVAKQGAPPQDIKARILRYDLHQNAVASSVLFVVSKLKWSALSGGGEDRSKCIKKLFSLLAWQLAQFWDSTKKSPMSLSHLSTPNTLHEIVNAIFQNLPIYDLLLIAVANLSEPLATLWNAMLHEDNPLPPSSRNHLKSREQLVSTWSVITNSIQTQGHAPYPASLPVALCPLIVCTLKSHFPKLAKITLNFWAVTFDKDKKSDYPLRLKLAFQEYFKVNSKPHGLQLNGLDVGVVVGVVSENSRNDRDSVEDSAPDTADADAVEEYSETQSHSEVVVMPNCSPRKPLGASGAGASGGSPLRKVCSTFMGQGRTTSPLRPPPPTSPASKALDKVLNSHQQQRGSDGVLGVRKRLALDTEEDYVAIPPAKKPCLLTEHQLEKQQERRVLPTMYNNLEHTQDLGGSEDNPIIVPESENESVATPTQEVASGKDASTSTATTSTASEIQRSEDKLVAQPLSTIVDLPNQKAPPTSMEAPPTTSGTTAPVPASTSGNVSSVATPTSVVTSMPSTDTTSLATPAIVTTPTNSLATPTKVLTSFDSLAASTTSTVTGTTKSAPVSKSTSVTASSTSLSGVPSSHQQPPVVVMSSSASLPRLVAAPPPPPTPSSTAIIFPLMSALGMNYIANVGRTTGPVVYPHPSAAAAIANAMQQVRGTSARSTQTRAPVPTIQQRAPVPTIQQTRPSVPMMQQTRPPVPTMQQATVQQASAPIVQQARMWQARAPTQQTRPPVHLLAQLGHQHPPRLPPASSIAPVQETLAASSPFPRPPPAFSSTLGGQVSNLLTIKSTPSSSSITRSTSIQSLLSSSTTNASSNVSSNVITSTITPSMTSTASSSSLSVTTGEKPQDVSQENGGIVKTKRKRQSQYDAEQMKERKLAKASRKRPRDATEVLEQVKRAKDTTQTTEVQEQVMRAKDATQTTEIQEQGERAKDTTQTTEVQEQGKRAQDATQTTEIQEQVKRAKDATQTTEIQEQVKRAKDATQTIEVLEKRAKDAIQTTEVSEKRAKDATEVPEKRAKDATEVPEKRAKDTTEVPEKRAKDTTEVLEKRAKDTTQTTEFLEKRAKDTTQTTEVLEQVNQQSAVRPSTPQNSREAGHVVVVAKIVSKEDMVPANTALTEPNVMTNKVYESEDPLTEPAGNEDANSEQPARDVVPESTAMETESTGMILDADDSIMEDSTELKSEENQSSPQKVVNGLPVTPPSVSSSHTDDHTPSNTPDNNMSTERSGSSTVSGILKHVSQFDTPCSAKQGAGRKVQFASEPDYKETENKKTSRTPKQGRSPRTPPTTFSSRRTLKMSHTIPTKGKTARKATSSDTVPIYPSLMDCVAPVEQILPALSPGGKFTHGLVQLVRARNITTVGEISSLTHKQVQALPIKSPKVPTLRVALYSFAQQEKGSKRKALTDNGSDSSTSQAKSSPKPSQPVEDSFLTESDPTVNTPIILATPDSQESSLSISHDHTYCSQAPPIENPDKDRTKEAIPTGTKDSSEATTKDPATLLPIAKDSTKATPTEEPIVNNRDTEVNGVEGMESVEEGGASELSQELFSATDEELQEKTNAKEPTANAVAASSSEDTTTAVAVDSAHRVEGNQADENQDVLHKMTLDPVAAEPEKQVKQVSEVRPEPEPEPEPGLESGQDNHSDDVLESDDNSETAACGAPQSEVRGPRPKSVHSNSTYQQLRELNLSGLEEEVSGLISKEELQEVSSTLIEVLAKISSSLKTVNSTLMSLNS